MLRTVANAVARPAARRWAPAASRGVCTTASCRAEDEAGAGDGVAAQNENLIQPYSEHARLGGVVEQRWARYNVEPSTITSDSAPTHAVVSWVSPEFVGRQATIFQPAQSAMTSGKADTKYWTIEFEHTNKWSSPLMGYLSAADPLKRLQEHMRFDSAQQAILFAKRNGWSYSVTAPLPPTPTPAVKNYAFTFLPERIEKKIKNLGPRGARKIFKKTTGNRSQWINHHHTKFGDHAWRSKQEAAKEPL